MENNQLIFSETLSDIAPLYCSGNVVHIICIAGEFSFVMNNERCTVVKSDYVILATGTFFSGVECSNDCRILLLAFPETIVASTAFNSNYGVIGHVALLANPILHLSSEDFEICLTDMIRLRKRVSNNGHLFYSELITTLLKAHILDLYDIHARSSEFINPESRVARIMNDFIALLAVGDYTGERSLRYYADKLCVTPHYLSEVSKKASGYPASYWINQFLTRELTRLISSTSMSMDEIAHRLNISSVSYLTRYIKKQIGLTPTELRRGVKRGC